MVQLQNARDNQKRKRAEDDQKKQEAEAGESFLVCRQSITEELTSKAPCCGQACQIGYFDGFLRFVADWCF
jgi:hypothetical protein